MSYKLIILLFYPVFSEISKILSYEETLPFLKSFIKCISYLLAGLPYLIILYRSKHIKKSISTKNLEGSHNAVFEIYLENQNNIKKLKAKKYIPIFLLSLINMIPILIETFVSPLLKDKLNDKFKYSSGVLYSILFYIIFSKIFLKSKIYKHQIISLVMISFCSSILLIIDIIKIFPGNVFSVNLVITLFYYILLIGGVYPLFNVLVKKHFETYLNNPYHLMFFIGLFNLISTITLYLFVYLYKDKNFFEIDIIKQIGCLYANYKAVFLLRFIFYIIIEFFWIGGIILTLYYFTPCHFIIPIALSEFLFRCINWIKYPDEVEKDPWYFIVAYIFSYVIIIFSGLIYNEVIIINLWSMEVNTFKYISFREKLELENPINNNEDNLNNRYSTETALLSFYEDRENEEEEK